MKILDIESELRANPYPGRGIILGRCACGEKAVMAYFIMGRSENSRNRVFVKTDDGIRTEAHDPSKMVDPSLIIYSPVRVAGSTTIVTNGDQTDTIYNSITAGSSYVEALRTREFEPDGPNFTPRISGVVDNKTGAYSLSILKSLYGDDSCCARYFWEYDKPKAGLGHFIHTYMGDGSPLPSFEGEPEPVKLTGGIDELTQRLWDSLNNDNKVSLFVEYLDLATGSSEVRIKNKNV